MLKNLMDGPEVLAAVDKMAAQIDAAVSGKLALVGIKRGGVPLANRLAKNLEYRRQKAVPTGVVDIQLYRDDGFDPREWPTVGRTELPFRPRDYHIVLVDDVLFTGRTVRAALEVVLDYGRPKTVKLAVMVDRGLRELPISADFVGKTLPTQADDHVQVHWSEYDSGEPEGVTLEKRVSC